MLHATRSLASGRRPHSCPRPFSGSNTVRPTVHLRAAAPEQVAEEAEGFLDLEDEMVQERIVLDDEARVAMRTAELMMPEYTLEAVLEAELQEADADVRNKALALLEDSLEASKGRLTPELTAAAVAAAANSDAIEVEEIEDFVGAAGFTKYDEEEEASNFSEEVLESIQKYKLSRQELATLLPPDWDTVNVDWFTNKRDDNIPLPEYKLTFLWQRENIAVAVDQVYSRGQTSPLTEYFVWPRKDAWEELKVCLESKPTVSERDRVILLNRLTEVINFWQTEGTKPALEAAQAAFPDCVFA